MMIGDVDDDAWIDEGWCVMMGDERGERRRP